MAPRTRLVPMLRVVGAILLAALGPAALGQAPSPVRPFAYPQFSGVYPHLAALSDSYSECGIGALVPWAKRLWYCSYVSHKAGSGVGLYEIRPNLSILRRPESVVGTHAGRMIHWESNQLILGPYLIDPNGKVRLLESLRDERITAVMRHLTDPARKVFIQAMEGNLYEADVYTLETRLLADLVRELGIQGRAHFKGGYTAQGRVVVANNSYDQSDAVRGSGDGRLAEWDGQRWTIIHRTAFCDVTTAQGVDARPDDQTPLYALGWDKRSVLLAVRTGQGWTTYRLPKGSQAYDHAWCTEWPRIREVAPGQLMVDMHGLFYLMSPELQPGRTASLQPLCYHLRMTPDFCTWQGRLVLAGNQCSAMGHRHRTGGQPQANLWFGSLEALRQWGAPAGWGGPWSLDSVAADTPSDPFFIHGFGARTLHLWQHEPSAEDQPVVFTVEVDRDGTGQWSSLESVRMPATGYTYRVLPDDLACVWMRLRADRACKATAQLVLGRPEGAAAQAPSPRFASLPQVDQARPTFQAALLPFAGRLWACAYQVGPDGRATEGSGLYEVRQDMQCVRRPESIPGVFANRKMVEGLLSIGPHLISDDGQVRTLSGLEGQHLVASIRHPERGKMFLLSVDGRLLEADLRSLQVRTMADIPEKLGLAGQGLRFHGGHLVGKTVLVAASGPDGLSGCLVEGTDQTWTVVDRAAFGELSNFGAMSEAVAAIGRDAASALLKIRVGDGRWNTYRLPKASPAYAQRPDAWPRLREVETERMLLDADGLFYETTGLAHAWFVRPVATHRRLVGDFCSWRGLLVLAGGDSQASSSENYVRGDEGLGLWLGHTDDLWQLGPPVGEGGPWLDTPVRAGEPSDPYLMARFAQKRLALHHDAPQPVVFSIEIDMLGQARAWVPYAQVSVAPGATTVHEFPPGFSAHWVRFTCDRPCRATARLLYR